MNIDHAPDRYDEHLTLKVPPMLWLTLVFLLRHLLLLGITFMPTTGEEITILRDLIRPEYLIADLIALPVLVVAVRRRPEAPDWMRRSWPAGRVLLILSALVYLILLTHRLLTSSQHLSDVVDEAVLISALLNLAVLAYLARSPLVRDLFREFPARDRTNAA
jgi:hypothetical protein